MVLERSDTKIKGYVCMYRCSAFRMFVYVKSLRGAFLKARKNWVGGGEVAWNLLSLSNGLHPLGGEMRI